ncbi:hypothetical protein AAVH_42679, partial [Aphelenchoides avenae]
ELLLASRIIPCAWLLLCHRSAVYKTKGVAMSGGDYHPASISERDEPNLADSRQRDGGTRQSSLKARHQRSGIRYPQAVMPLR